ncbi:MAG TPA: hypothetical protein DCP31_06095, partial [Cyanobacteria bacterium UBA8543]|nr:hypothetical protein [Cyanobacteria bacterium UBA8543]
WRFENGKLQINLLQEKKYIKCEYSQNFPNLPLIEIIPQYLNQCRTLGRNKTMRAFRTWVREQLA